jgi:hypothetical protein
MRRRTLLLLLPLAACAGDDGPLPPPPRYDYLIPLRFSVGAITFTAPAAGIPSAVVQPAPLVPAQLLMQMARERLSAIGGEGSARFLGDTAQLTRERVGREDRLQCLIRCRIEILGADRAVAAFAEAQAQRSVTLPSSPAARARAADTIVRQCMDSLNVEFEYQVRQNLRAWLPDAAVPVDPVAPPPGPIESEPLPHSPAPGAAPPGSAAPPAPPGAGTQPETLET